VFGQVAEDHELQWISPNETVVEADEGIDDSAVTAPVASALPPANAEAFSAVQWNLHQIHSDQTAANGDRGNGLARARVAVLDTGIVASHIDIAANLNLALSTSFVSHGAQLHFSVERRIQPRDPCLRDRGCPH